MFAQEPELEPLLAPLIESLEALAASAAADPVAARLKSVISGGTTQTLVQHNYGDADRLTCTATLMNPSAFASPKAKVEVQHRQERRPQAPGMSALVSTASRRQWRARSRASSICAGSISSLSSRR